MKNNKKYMLLLTLASLSSMAFADTALTVGDIAKGLNGMVSRLDVLIVAFSYAAGFCLTIFGILKLKEHSDSKGQTKLSTALVYVIGGTLLLCLNTYILMGMELLSLKDSPINESAY